MELIFEIRDAEEGGFYARALGHGIFTEAETWDELRANVLEAVSLHFEDATDRPRLVRIHYVRDPMEAAARFIREPADQHSRTSWIRGCPQKGRHVWLRHPGPPVHTITVRL